MLKKMQRRFILAAMAAFGAVLLILLVGINVANYFQATSMQDRMARNLLGYEKGAAGRSETPFPTRFFAVHCDAAGNVRFVSRDYLSSAEEEEAVIDYAREVLAGGKVRGYYGDYRYLVSRDRIGTKVLFLNAANTLQSIRALFFVSTVVGLVSLAVVFVLVLLFSGYAIRPYAENIQRQKRFITDAGHELKTPITSISASADIAAMEYEGDEWIENIRKQTVRLGKLVNDLVALSRLDEETPFPEKSDFSLSDAAWEAAEPFAVLAKAEGKFYCQRIEEGLILRGSRNSIQQLISILLDNAVKYSNAGGEISMEIRKKRGKACVEVANTCELPGIPDLDRLFDRFYRVDESRSAETGGTGIGLSMAQAIVQAHGGRIEARRQDENEIVIRAVLPMAAF